ncbi:hypothetical protein QRX25_09930 [Bacillus sp. L381]|uniref:DUF6414 family protein n=1 Tax=Bacillus TaxID=1386 RepID=UPI001BA6657C|nr:MULTISPECIES: hypothetical protein [Bacillus]MCR9038525.1 hypothetical protein [Bacillus velezensis]QUN07878.1 hypothetical protein KEF49_09795 [Bacillus amyloliquefaciens]QYM83489.1 hypothetical protein KTJ85_04215 [Bacillus sp. 7D3]QZY10089.1 hypothetical protein K7B13_09865 [Bacillus amyloliquefaciens]WIX19989.1 hypothetical protein QRX25_09930 [Bacillus sp. L381]
MKEILYLDTELMNSNLAQLDQGLTTDISHHSDSQKTESDGSNYSNRKNAELGARLGIVSLNVNGKLGADAQEGFHEGRSFLEGEKDILNKSFHDYSLSLLMDKLTEEGLLKETDSDLKEGDFFIIESELRLNDFSLIKRFCNPEKTENLLLAEIADSPMTYKDAKKLTNKTNPNAKDRELMGVAEKIVTIHDSVKPTLLILKQLHAFSDYLSDIFDDHSFIKVGNNAGVIKNSNLRESTTSLSLRSENNRKVKLLGRFTSKKQRVFNGFNLEELKADEFYKMPNLFLDVALGSMQLINEGDNIVSPIAIYFE